MKLRFFIYLILLIRHQTFNSIWMSGKKEDDEMAKEYAKPFYNSAAWKNMRKEILKRDNYKCQCKGCHEVATEVHHKTEITEENIHDINITLNPNNLISLCSECHKAITKAEHGKEQIGIVRYVIDESGYPIPITPPRWSLRFSGVLKTEGIPHVEPTGNASKGCRKEVSIQWEMVIHRFTQKKSEKR